MSGEWTIKGGGQPRWPFSPHVLRNALRTVETQPGDIELLASAPLMLEALEGVVSSLDGVYLLDNSLDNQAIRYALTIARQALAAARGESPTPN